MAKVYITAIRLSGGTSVQHITNVWYSSTPAGLATEATTGQMVSYIEQGTCQAYVQDPKTQQEARVLVVTPRSGPKYLRTKADDDPNDNLLQLPRK